MNDLRRMLHDMTHRLFGEECTVEVRMCAERGEWPEELWRQIEKAGLTLAAIPESLGGAGATLADAMVIMRSLGNHAVPAPLAETILGNWLLARAGATSADGPLAIAPVIQAYPLTLSRIERGWSVHGKALYVPWARNSKNIVVVAHLEDGRQAVVSIPTRDCQILPAVNVAGEPRDEVVFDSVFIPTLQTGQPSDDVDYSAALLRVGALSRCHQMVGAMEWLLERSCAYSGERMQFGRPIGGFQAVQQMIATMAGQVSAASMAAESAMMASEHKSGERIIGHAKARVGNAAGEVAALAHQIHGAMGYSYEYPLHYRTRRLWAWREEFGSERFWQILTGRRIASCGGDALWRDLTL